MSFNPPEATEGATVDTTLSTRRASATGARAIRNPPAFMLTMVSRSSMSACRFCAQVSTISTMRPWAGARSPALPASSSSVYPRMLVSGVRSSCDTDATKSFLSRSSSVSSSLVRASAAACCSSTACAERSSRSARIRSVMSRWMAPIAYTAPAASISG